MDAILNFTQYVINALLGLIIFVVLAYIILTWLVSFDVVNLRNRFVYSVSRALDAIALPILAPFRRLLPAMGGLDFSPILFFIVAEGIKIYLIPPFFAWLHGLVAGGGAPPA